MGSWSLHLDLEIQYDEDEGNPAERGIPVARPITVTAVHLDAAGDPVALAAHCGLSGAFRTFALARIESCRELGRDGLVQDLAGLLRQRYGLTRAGKLEALQRHLGPELTVLLAIGRADGLFQQREKELIAAYLSERIASLDVPGAFGVQELSPQLVWLDAPSRESFLAAAASLAGTDPCQLQALYALCVAVADVKASRDGFEQAALDQLRTRWFGSPDPVSVP